jgi:hypothetical protein
MTDVVETIEPTTADIAIKLFTTSPGTSVDLSEYKDGRILIINKVYDDNTDFNSSVVLDDIPTRYVVHTCDHNIYVGSPMCEISTNVITRGMLPHDLIVNRELFADDKPYACIIFREDEALFQEGYLDNLSSFYEIIKFADNYCLNVPYICTLVDKIMWLLSFKENQKDVWRANKILLQNIEQKLYNKPKFEAIDAAANDDDYDYPTGAQKVPRYVTMGEIKAPELLSRDDFSMLMEFLAKNDAHDFMTKLLVIIGSSIEYCDMIFSNATAVKMTKSTGPFGATAFYALRIFYLEEIAMYSRKRSAGRFVMPIDVACVLPRFDVSYLDSPYLTMLAGGVTAGKGLTLPVCLLGERGIHSLDAFKERLNIYTDGDIFKYLEWSRVDQSVVRDDRQDDTTPDASPDTKGKMEAVEALSFSTALNGSLITACAIINPLEAVFENTSDYFDEYYPKRPGIAKIVKRRAPVNTMFKLANYSDDDSDLDNEPENRAELPDFGIHSIDYSDIDMMIRCDNLYEFDKIAEQHFKSIERAVDELKIASEITLERVDTENKHKWRINGLTRTIDIFHVDGIAEVIVKYHLPCVRAWYDGDMVHCFSSFITAAMTGMNIDIRWTSNRKDVRDIVLKYFQRGFGTLLTKADRESLLQYINEGNQWPSHRPGNSMRHWEMQRFMHKPMLINHGQALFNPSLSRIGIHAHLDTRVNAIGKIPMSEQGLAGSGGGRFRRRRRVRMLGDAKRMAGKEEYYKDFKEKGVAVLPSACPTLAAYL